MGQLTQTTPELQSNVDWEIGKTRTDGIKVDTAAPTFPWHDMLGEVTDIGSGGVKPSLNTFQGGIKGWQFSVNDEIMNRYHVPHDYVAGSDIHIHFHWACIVGTITSGGVTWGAEVSYAKGHNQEPFTTPITTTVQEDASTVQYQHMITEVQLSATSPSASQIDSDDIEPDGVIQIRTFLSGNTINGTPEPFLEFVDIHYQSTSIGTKDKVPDFYT
jgi:hypothetical protein